MCCWQQGWVSTFSDSLTFVFLFSLEFQFSLLFLSFVLLPILEGHLPPPENSCLQSCTFDRHLLYDFPVASAMVHIFYDVSISPIFLLKQPNLMLSATSPMKPCSILLGSRNIPALCGCMLWDICFVTYMEIGMCTGFFVF
jgi:hypothetical protein